MRRLYLRVYLAVLASIVLSVVLAGAAWRIFAARESFAPRAEFFAAAASAMLPPANASSQAQRIALERWRALSGYDLALLDRSGAVIAAVAEGGARDWDDVLARDDNEARRGPRWAGPFGAQRVALDDGRILYARPPVAHRGLWPRLGWLAALMLVGLAVAVCAWPVVRRLTRDLERLEASVAALGAGDFSARASVSGKDEVARLAMTFNAAAARIQTLLETNRALLANASHELRSPLARLRMGVQSLVEAPAGDPRRARAQDEIARNIRELDSLVEEILLASRLEARPDAVMRTEVVDLRALAAEECARVDAALDIGPGADRPLRADPKLLARALKNLLENATRYGGGAPIEAGVSIVDGRAAIEVRDRGPGVAESERERIFEPFYRAAGASERAGGVGLGLSLVRQIAALHGGRALCLPRAGGGVCFRIEWPAQPA